MQSLIKWIKKFKKAFKAAAGVGLAALLLVSIPTSAQVLRPDRGSLLTPGLFSKVGNAIVTTSASDTLGSPTQRIEAGYFYTLDALNLAISGTVTGNLSVGGALTVSGTSTLGNVVINGTCTGTGCAGGSSSNLNQAYLAATGTPQISLSPSIGALTIGDTVGGLGTTLFQIQDRTNSAGDYSQRFLTASATSVNINYSTATTVAPFTINTPAVTTAYSQTINCNGSTVLTTGGCLKLVGPTSTASLVGGTGLMSISAAGNYTTSTGVGGLFQINAPAMTAGTIASIVGAAVMTGNGNLLTLSANAATSATNLVAENFNGCITCSGHTITSTGNVTTIGNGGSASLLDIKKTGTATTAAFSGSLLRVDYEPTYTTTPTTNSGTPALFRRVTTINGANTTNLTDAVGLFTDDASVTTGTLNHSGSVVRVLQSFASTTGDALSVTSLATGAWGATITAPHSVLQAKSSLATSAITNSLFSVNTLTGKLFEVSATSTAMKGGTGSVSANAVTCNATVCRFTDTTDINLASTRAAITLTNSAIAATSNIQITLCGTQDSGAMIVGSSVPGAGSATIILANAGTGNQTTTLDICVAVFGSLP